MLDPKKMMIGAMIIYLIIAPLCAQDTDSLHYKKGQAQYALFEEFFGDNPDSVLHYLNLSSANFKKGEYWSDYIATLNGYCAFYAQNNDFARSQQYSKLAVEESIKHLDENDLMYSVSLGNNAFRLMHLGDFKKAIAQFKQGLEIERHHKDIVLIAASLKNLGDSYAELGDLDEALKYYNELIAFDRTNDHFMKKSLSRIFRRKGLAHLRKNEDQLAFESFVQARHWLSSINTKRNYLKQEAQIDVNFGLARIHARRGNKDSLFSYVEKGLEHCNKKFTFHSDEGYIILGSYYLENGNFERALEYLTLAKEQNAQKYKEFKKHISFVELDLLIAEATAKMGDLDHAIASNLAALSNLSIQPIDLSGVQVPILKDITNPLQGMKAYYQLGLNYIDLYKTEGARSDLESAYLSLKNAARLVSEVRKTFQESASLIRFSEIVLPIYESAIATAIRRHELSGDQRYLEEAFDYNEKSKAVLLLESITKSSAIQIGEIPDSLKQKEKEYKQVISALKRNLYDESNKLNQDSFAVASLERKLFKESEAYDQLIQKFEQNFPKYYRFKYDFQTSSVPSIQKQLKGTGCQIIQFFTGEKDTYVFTISDREFLVRSIGSKDVVEKEVEIVKNFLSSPPSGTNVHNELREYSQASLKVYETYLKDVIAPNSRHLIIVSDGQLGFLPFEALLTGPPLSKELSFSPDNLPYLLNDYLVSYSYSTTLFMNSLHTEKSEVSNSFFGVAPSFDLFNDSKKLRVCNENALYSLRCSQDEVRQIKHQFGGKILTGQDATLESTLEGLINSRIIHLATHACLDDDNPEFNKIYLADDYLSNNDLYNLQLKSELAVLSACETGSGRLAKGEGVMSLARGFIHGGCPSIVMSLWSIDDCATSRIMIHFYDEMKKGESKVASLKNAKIRYLKEAKKVNQHPFFWAAFVQIGNFHPIEIESSNKLYAILGGLALVFLIFLFFRKKY